MNDLKIFYMACKHDIEVNALWENIALIAEATSTPWNIAQLHGEDKWIEQSCIVLFVEAINI